MLFNSLDFLIFFSIFFILYWGPFRKSLKYQNMLLLVASYIFYGWWDYRFLILILLSTIVDFLCAQYINQTKKIIKKKIGLLISIFFNISILFFFKYYNFFIDTFFEIFNINDSEFNLKLFNVILPVGISFYTFQTMSYTIDVYWDKVKPTKNLISFAVYVSFFPQLVAGPIERASTFLPQVIRSRNFNFQIAKAGIYLILMGFFKKLVVADAVASSVDSVFSNYDRLNYISLFFGSVLFSFQIYCDFSGYTDIARGLAKLLGFELRLNFNYPYFSTSIADFWRRWHISLSSWFRDYLYIPLGGSRVSLIKSIRNVFIIFIISGLWHGANLTFVFWGLIHAIMFIPSFILKKIKSKNNFRLNNNIKVLMTFMVVNFAWIFFRSDTIESSFAFIVRIFSLTDGLNYFSIENMGAASFSNLIIAVFFIIVLIIIEFFQFKEKRININPFTISIFIIIIILFGQFTDEKSFIYFQF